MEMIISGVNTDYLHKFKLLPPGWYCDPSCLLVGWLFCAFVVVVVSLSFVSSHPATGCNVRWAAGWSLAA